MILEIILTAIVIYLIILWRVSKSLVKNEKGTKVKK
jgi:hypothetical protein